MTPDELAALRSDVARLRRNASRKVNRLRNAKGVDIGGTKFDPRLSSEKPSRYNARQLAAYRDRLQGFTSRKVQYVPDSHGKPMRGSKFKGYKGLESQFKGIVKKNFDSVKDIKLPTGTTIGDRLAETTPSHPQMELPSVINPFRAPNKKSSSISSEAALQKLTNDMAKRLDPKYFARKAREGRESFTKMAEIMNAPDLVREVGKLSEHQFSILWHYTSFATSVSINYLTYLKQLQNKNDNAWNEIASDELEDARELIKWALDIEDRFNKHQAKDKRATMRKIRKMDVT